jgi:hypothetical protein
MVFNATFNNISVISWRSVLLVVENKLSNNVVHLALIEIRTHNIGTDCIGSCKSNYHTITATTAAHIIKILIWLTINELVLCFLWFEWKQIIFFFTTAENKQILKPEHLKIIFWMSLYRSEKKTGVSYRKGEGPVYECLWQKWLRLLILEGNTHM